MYTPYAAAPDDKGELWAVDSTAILRFMLSFQFFHLNLTSLLNINVADPDPGSGVFLTPGFGSREGNQDPDRDEQPRSYFRELRSLFFGG